MQDQILPKIFLFVPGNKPDRIPKAFGIGADEVVVDWEDAVAENEKADAVRHMEAYCADPAARPVWLRINAPSSARFAADLAALSQLDSVKGVVLPKTERPADITTVHHECGKPVIAAIETAKGMLNLPQLAFAQGLHALSYGCLDLCGELGMTHGTPAADTFFNHLRIELLLHSRLNGLHPPIETVFPDMADNDGLRAFTRFWRDMGFGGMLCVHPRQVAVTKLMMLPSPEETAFAEKVLAEAGRNPSAVFQVDGRMVDAPVIARAKKLLGRT
ncbi:HpcH/HpaI aldolase/citrate lyase family protein [Neisseria sp. WLZKY-1]|uniref:HpcH/HpaI aldolase/citrate lyase family protein n=1 Tax=Neisseria sp. WLZKY-1 TaxID=3390377 RepID=UPI003978144A